MLQLDMEAFASLAESMVRVTAQQRIEETYRERLVAHDPDGNKVKEYIKDLQRIAGTEQAKDGDDLLQDLSKLGIHSGS